MVTAYLGIGSNLGNRKNNIEKALEILRDSRGITVEQVSSIIETEPVGGPPQGKFLNGAIRIKTNLSAMQLLTRMHQIEDELGRVRLLEKNEPRTLDLDILLYGDERIDEPDLKVPHPRMHEREFVMRPLQEIKNENNQDS